MKVIIYGAGNGGKRLLNEFRRNEEPYEIIAFVDRRLKGSKVADIPVIAIEQIKEQDYERIFIATMDGTVKPDLVNQHGIPESMINTSRYLNTFEVGVRYQCLRNISSLINELNIKGAAAELGVYQGDFACHINSLFPDRKLYLYDTFEGFSSVDVKSETNVETVKKYIHYSATSEEAVLNRMPYPNNVIIRKGWFPETAVDINEKFAFVSLDPDLYEPTLAGLRFFYPRMESGGIMLIHDYTDEDFDGVKKAVHEFMREYELSISPMGDYRTLALIKPITKGSN